MTANKTGTEKVEELFLKIFKVVILLVMGIGLIASISFAIYSGTQYSQKPIEPKPAKTPPQKDVSLDDLIRELTPKEPKKQEEKSEKNETISTPTPSLNYLEDVTALYRCSIEFAKATGVAVEEADGLSASAEIERYRGQIENIAKARPSRGESYVKDAVKFTCGALKNGTIISLRKEEKISSVFVGTLNFHLKEWDRIQQEKREFEEAEQERIESEKTVERNRVAEARENALLALYAAGVAFAVFMAIALYLIFAKIENNLRKISENNQSL